MRICILTQPLGANYGGILQAFALQKVLRDMGHQVTTLRFMPETAWVPTGIKKNLLTLRRFISKYLKGNKKIVFCNPDRQTAYAYKELNRFLEERMDCLNVRAPLSAGELPSYDAYIVGSDQVWRPAYSPCLPNFYLDFLVDVPVRRIAYAASFGVDSWEADPAMTERIRPLAQRFDAISVRETSGIALCEKYLGVTAEFMPDPTLLLSQADYRNLCKPAQKDQQPYIAAYILDKGDRELHYLDALSEATGLPVKMIGQLDWSTSTDSIERWLGALSGADYVVTNSFHGTVFSILFERNFYTLVNSARGASRFETLLGTLGLQDRLVDGKTPEASLSSVKTIDYKEINKAIDSLRQQGLSYLKTQLK